MYKAENGSSKEKKSYWVIKITLITFIIALLFSFAAELATGHSSIFIAVVLLIVLIAINIVFDAIAVAVTACDRAPLAAMASKKIKGSKLALKLSLNADKVANICADVIGDICGIISGACVIVIIIRISTLNQDINTLLYTILLSSTIAAAIVGGKALMKTIAINKSKEILMIVARIISVIVKERKI